MKPGLVHWNNLYITPLCAGRWETTARGFRGCGKTAQHIRTSLLPPLAPETPKMSCLLSPSALPLPSLLHTPGKAACHYRNTAEVSSPATPR